MKIRLAQQFIHPKQIQRNAESVLGEIEKAKKDLIDILVFPELCLSGYLIGDLWEKQSFLKDCEYWGEQIRSATSGTNSPVVIFGNVASDWSLKGEDGRTRKYNAAYVAQNGEWVKNNAIQKSFFPKTLLPNYREFEETRYFYDSRKLALEQNKSLDQVLNPVNINIKGEDVRVGLVICEDSWDQDYSFKPAEILVGKGAQIFINLSCSPFTDGKFDKRLRLVKDINQKYKIPFSYCNAVSLQNNGKSIFTFDGRSFVTNSSGELIHTGALFLHDKVDFHFDPANKTISSEARNTPKTAERMEELYAALRFGITEFLNSAGLKKVVIGSSGGIDSAVTAALYRTILEPQNILLVNMPSQFNSDLTKNASFDLAKNLGCLYAVLPIDESVQLTKKQIDQLKVASLDGKVSETLSLSSFHLENVQARDRSSRILSAVASAFGGGFTCNANKAETTVGYSTLYGDLGGFLATLADLWKSDVYSLGKYLNENVFKMEVIPQAIFDVVPSAELSENQNVNQGKGDPLIYPYHDRLFASWMQTWNSTTPEEILEWYLKKELNHKLKLAEVDVYKLFPNLDSFVADLEKYWNLFQGMGVAKRIQAPPILAISSRAFGFDYREAQGVPYYSTKYIEMKAEIFKNLKR